MISTPQYLQLFSDQSRDGIYRRLQRLFHHEYLDRIGSNPNAPLVYALGRRGAEVLGIPPRREGGDRYIAHQLMIGDFRVALTLACRGRAIIVGWKKLGDDLPIRPDGVCSLQFPALPEGRSRAHFFLEADRSTMTRERFVAKLVAYWNWHLVGGHTATLGIKTFRVLTVTRSEERLASLVQAARQAQTLGPGLRHFWFTAERRFTLGAAWSILGAIWEAADRPGEVRSLLP